MSFTNRPNDVKRDIASINGIWNEYTVGCNTGDLDRWLSIWIDEGIQMPPDEPGVIGKEKIRGRMKGLFDKFTLNIAITNKETRIAGDLAFSRGTYTLSITPKGGGGTNEFAGKYLTILEKQADGSWKIARDCFNYDGPPASSEKE